MSLLVLVLLSAPLCHGGVITGHDVSSDASSRLEVISEYLISSGLQLQLINSTTLLSGQNVSKRCTFLFGSLRLFIPDRFEYHFVWQIRGGPSEFPEVFRIIPVRNFRLGNFQSPEEAQESFNHNKPIAKFSKVLAGNFQYISNTDISLQHKYCDIWWGKNCDFNFWKGAEWGTSAETLM